MRTTLWLSTLLVTAIVLIFTLGKPFIDIPGLSDASAHRIRSLDLELFNGWHNPPVWYGPYTNTFGNVALFLPVGALLVACLWSPGAPGLRLVGEASLVSVALSLFIEVMQYCFSLGYSDVDDLLFNGLGGLLGAMMMWRRLARRAPK